MAKTCSRCSNPRGKSGRYCNACHAAAMRAFRKVHALTPSQRKKMNCRSYANVYHRRGKLKPKPCEDCGSGKAEKHHEDYTRPLQVIWLCRECHLQRHRKKEKGNHEQLSS